MMNDESKRNTLTAFLAYHLMKGDRPNEATLAAAYTYGVTRALAREADEEPDGSILKGALADAFNYYVRSYPATAPALDRDEAMDEYDAGRDWALHCVHEMREFSAYVFLFETAQDKKGGD